MITINNTDLEPMPLHDSGKWLWNGYEITGTGTTADGEEYQKKGMWMWVSEDTQQGWMANATVQEINEYYKPRANAHASEQFGNVLNKALLGLGIVTALIITIGYILL